MSAENSNQTETEQQQLLQQLQAAEAALRKGLHIHGFGGNIRAHMERALTHTREAYVSINEGKPVRTVQQLAEDQNHIERLMNNCRRTRSQRI